MARVIRFPEDKQEPASPFGHLFLALGAVLFVAALSWGGVIEYRLRSWPKAEVTTIQSHIAIQTYGSCTGPCTNVTVEYFVNGKKYSKTSCFGDICSPNRRMESKIYEWWPGTKHIVPYPPGHPEQLKPIAGHNIDWFVAPVTLGTAGLTLMAIGGVAFIITSRAQKVRLAAAEAKRGLQK